MNEYQTKRVTVFFFQDKMVMERILVVDDDRAIQKALKRLFETDGYKVEIRGDGNAALEAFRTVAPTAIILDLRLPIVSGREVCREIRRQTSAVPIVVLSAATDVLDKVTLFEMGADDYVTKPFSPRELLARVRAAIRHAHRIDTCELATFDGVRVDFTKMEATFDGRAVGLTNHEFNLIKFFSQNAERVISRDELLTEACGYEVHSTLRTVDNHIWKLRQKLERDPENPIHFLTIRRVGYKFIP
jgi:two-component system, OmpR family, alkaline phosphatase synthesis response regulator PhoP